MILRHCAIEIDIKNDALADAMSSQTSIEIADVVNGLALSIKRQCLAEHVPFSQRVAMIGSELDGNGQQMVKAMFETFMFETCGCRR